MSYFLKLIENCLLVVKPTVTACITCCRLVVRLFRLHCDLGDNYDVPRVTYDLTKRSFLLRCLYREKNVGLLCGLSQYVNN